MELIVCRQSALHGFHILERVECSELWVSSHFLVDFWVVLHCARAQWVETGVNAEVVVAHIGVVTHHGKFVHFREGRSLLAKQIFRKLCDAVVTQLVFGKGIALATWF